MKANVEIDMTPGEARKVMGLPDVNKMQENIAAEMQKRVGRRARSGNQARSSR
jgi:hypothetical protein